MFADIHVALSNLSQTLEHEMICQLRHGRIYPCDLFPPRLVQHINYFYESEEFVRAARHVESFAVDSEREASLVIFGACHPFIELKTVGDVWRLSLGPNSHRAS